MTDLIYTHVHSSQIIFSLPLNFSHVPHLATKFITPKYLVQQHTLEIPSLTFLAKKYIVNSNYNILFSTK